MLQPLNLYTPLWSKYRPAILQFMKLSVGAPQTYRLSKHEFESIGARFKAGYLIDLEIQDGVVLNNSAKTTVAKDLLAILRSSKTAGELFQNNYFKITLDRSFLLTIFCKSLAVPEIIPVLTVESLPLPADVKNEPEEQSEEQ